MFCIGGYYSPDVNMEQFNSYIQELDTLIQATKRNYPARMITGDFNSKATAWEGHVNDRRGTSFLKMCAPMCGHEHDVRKFF